MDRQLNLTTFAEMRRLALSSPDFESFHEHYQLQRGAFDPGFAHSDHEYEYLNNGDSVPDYPWVEDVFSADLLKDAYAFFLKRPEASFFQFLTEMYYCQHMYQFDNVHMQRSLIQGERYSCLAWASKRKISNEQKARLAKYKRKFGINSKTPYLYSRLRPSFYAIKDRKYDIVIYADGTIQFRDLLILYAVQIPIFEH